MCTYQNHFCDHVGLSERIITDAQHIFLVSMATSWSQWQLSTCLACW